MKDNAYAKMPARKQSSLACHTGDTVEENWLNEKIQLLVEENSFWPFLLNFIGHDSFVCLNIRYTRLQPILHKLLVLRTQYNNQNVYRYFKWIIISFKSNFHRISTHNFNSLLFYKLATVAPTSPHFLLTIFSLGEVIAIRLFFINGDLFLLSK